MNRSVRLLSLNALALLFFVSAMSGDSPQNRRDKTITVVTRNLYYGADLGPAIAAVASGDPQLIVAAVTELWGMIRFTDFPARAQGLADEIAAVQPELIGLQEAALWRSDPYDGEPLPNAGHIEYDFVQLLVDALADRGLHYDVAASATGFDAEFPGFLSESDYENGILSDIRLTDREVILARTDLKTSDLKISNPRSANFDTNFTFPLADGSEFVLLRGWASVDAKIRGKSLRFVTTHLEDESVDVRNAQALEILSGPADTALPAIVVMDANSDANADPATEVYAAFAGDGFVDSWFAAHPASEVTSCCNAPDLTNAEFPVADDDEGRIDMILFRGAGDFGIAGADLLGADPDTSRVVNSSGIDIWPSDHAGLGSMLVIRN